MTARSSRWSATTIELPFLLSRPLTDLHWTVVLMPLWWLLGGEQFIPVLLLALAGLKVVLFNKRLRMHPILGWLALFIAIQILSALFIVEPIRYVSFLRSLAMHVMAFLVVFVLLNSTQTVADLRRSMVSLTAFLGFSSLLGLAGVLGLLRPDFTSLIGSLLPSAILETDYGQQILHRRIGGTAWFQGLGSYFRLDGLSLFSTTYGSALAIGIPVTMWLARSASSHLGRLVFGATLMLMAFNLVFTTGRTALVGVAIAGLYILLVSSRPTLKVILIGSGLLALVASALFLPEGAVEEGLRTAVFARGQGSAVSRTTIYRYTLEGVLERPLLGWGTERDIQTQDSTFPYPAGSHSDILGTLYKHGILGLLALVGLWLSVWRSSRPRQPAGGQDGRPTMTSALQHLRGSLLAALVVSVATVLSLDATLMLAFWVVVGSAVVAGQGRLTASPGSAVP